MKIKAIIVALATVALTMVSCNNANKTEGSDAEQVQAITVEEVLKQAPALVKSGDTVTVEGVVDHLCKHGGKRAFISGAQGSILRCESTAESGGKFAQNTLNKPIIVKGVVKEDRINEARVKQMEESYAQQVANQEAEHGEEPEVGCETERKAAGQGDLDKFADRMADHRAKIAASSLKDENGEPYYVQSYYILTSEYSIAEK